MKFNKFISATTHEKIFLLSLKNGFKFIHVEKLSHVIHNTYFTDRISRCFARPSTHLSQNKGPASTMTGAHPQRDMNTLKCCRISQYSTTPVPPISSLQNACVLTPKITLALRLKVSYPQATQRRRSAYLPG